MKRNPLYCLIFALLFVFFAQTPAYSATYDPGSAVSIPITFSADENVTAADFTVSTTNATITSVSCGGSGFASVGSSGNQCILANLGGGAASGTVATVEVTAGSEGSFSVSASGVLSNGDGQPAANGNLAGASHSITSPTSAPEPEPTATPTPQPDTPTNTPAPRLPTNTPGPPTNTPTPTETPTPTPTEIPESEKPNVFLVDTDGEENPVTRNEVIVYSDEHVEAKFKPSSFDESEQVIQPSLNTSEVLLDFSELIVRDGNTTTATLTSGLTINKQNQENNPILEIPESTSFFVTTQQDNQEIWDGKVIGYQTVDPSSIQLDDATVKYAVEVGREDFVIHLSNPVKITLPDQAGRSVGFMHSSIFKEITTQCPEDTSMIAKVLRRGLECFLVNGNDIDVWTTHFSTYFSFEKANQPVVTQSYEKTSKDKSLPAKIGIVVSLAILILISVVLILRMNKKSKQTNSDDSNNNSY